MQPRHFKIIFCAFFIAAVISPYLAMAHSDEDKLRRAGVINFDAWNNQDLDVLIDAGWTRGFGFRTTAPRTEASYTPEVVRSILVRFFDSLDYYKLTPGEATVAIDGNIGLIWGFHTEEIKHKNRPPEIYRVRSSATMKKDARGNWQTIMSHRDIQTFDKDGRYVPIFDTH